MVAEADKPQEARRLVEGQQCAAVSVCTLTCMTLIYLAICTCFEPVLAAGMDTLKHLR